MNLNIVTKSELAGDQYDPEECVSDTYKSVLRNI